MTEGKTRYRLDYTKIQYKFAVCSLYTAKEQSISQIGALNLRQAVMNSPNGFIDCITYV